MLLKRFALLTGLIAFNTVCFAQKKTILGLSLTGENTSYSDFVAGFGGTIEKQLGKHHGFETGIYYRNFKEQGRIFVDGSLYGTFYTRENYLSIPVLYKFHSQLLNFSLGPTFDIYTGWKRINKGLPLTPNFYRVDDKFHTGLMFKISKTINLTKRTLLEPEIRFNPIFYYRRSFYGIGISYKYVLTK